MEELTSYLWAAVIAAAGAAIAATFKYIGGVVRHWVDVHITSKEKEDAARESVALAADIYKALDGPARFEKAAENLAQLLEQKGIPVTELEIMNLVSSAYTEFKSGMGIEEEPIDPVMLEMTLPGPVYVPPAVAEADTEVGDEEGGSL